jgi:hypothetical protein
MIETPASFNDRSAARPYPADNLVGFRYHTGADLRPLRPDEPCPVLFRDLGPVATALFLRGQLRRLAGPQSPIIYTRTEAYVEPYDDPERIGRLLFLRPLRLQVWHSGVPAIYVARATVPVDAETIAFVPGDVPLAAAARRAAELTHSAQVREVFGGRAYDEAIAETLCRLDGLAEELARTEEMAGPLRRCLQAGDERAREEMERVGLTEADLCAAWHHLPRSRRGAIAEALRCLDKGLVRQEGRR